MDEGFNPSFIVRDAIGSMEVKCLNGVDESNKRARGNDGEAVPSSDGCNWSGKCEDLQNHENVCDFKMITCSIDGCNHECLRKDINEHLSGGGGFLRHMNLMKQSISASYEAKMKHLQQSNENKMKAMKKFIMENYKKEMEAMKESYDEKMDEMKDTYNNTLEDIAGYEANMRNKLRYCENKIEAMKQSVTQSITADYEKKINNVNEANTIKIAETTKQLSELTDEIKSMRRKISGVSHPLTLQRSTGAGEGSS